MKGYTGCVDVSMNTWSLDGRGVDNALAKANYVAKILASKLKHSVPVGVYAPWCQGVVLITGRKGEEVSLHKSEGNLSIYTPNQIVSALTNEWGITAPHKFQVTEQQKNHVLDTIGQVALVEQRNNRIQDFEKTVCLFSQNGLEVWKAQHTSGEWQTTWLLKILTPANCETQVAFQQQEQQLRAEFKQLQQLSGCTGVPYTAPFIQEGEQLVLPLKMPKGQPLSVFKAETVEQSLLLFILRRSATALQQIHHRGIWVGRWHENSVFISDEGDVEFIDIGGEGALEEDLRAYAHTFLPIAKATELPWVTEWFADLAQGNSHNLDQLRADLSALIAKGADAPLAPLPAQLTAGNVINNCYHLDKQLNHSEHSELWQAQHTEGLYTCALSVYRNVSSQWSRLYSVYNSLSSLYHPHIEQVIQFGQLSKNGEVFISRAWVNGLPLGETPHDQVKAYGITWFKQLLTALQYLHNLDIYHGAICQNNIICHQHQAVLVNFGIGHDIAESSPFLQWVDPVLWSEATEPEKDLYGLVVSTIEALCFASETESNSLVDALHTLALDSNLKKVCEECLALSNFLYLEKLWCFF